MKKILNRFDTKELEEVNPYKIQKDNILEEAKQIVKENNKTEVGVGNLMTPLSISNDYLLSVNFTNCAVNQRDQYGNERGMCWAAAVASVVRCLKGYTTLMAYNVCDKMGISYDIGADIYTVVNALANYGVTYSVYPSYGPWTNIYNKINAGRPITMGANSYKGGHMVTIWACQSLNSQKYIHFYNSGTASPAITLYNESSTTFTYLNAVFTWVETAW